jgi:hypothetical protein
MGKYPPLLGARNVLTGKKEAAIRDERRPNISSLPARGWGDGAGSCTFNPGPTPKFRPRHQKKKPPLAAAFTNQFGGGGRS